MGCHFRGLLSHGAFYLGDCDGRGTWKPRKIPDGTTCFWPLCSNHQIRQLTFMTSEQKYAGFWMGPNSHDLSVPSPHKPSYTSRSDSMVTGQYSNRHVPDVSDCHGLHVFMSREYCDEQGMNLALKLRWDATSLFPPEFQAGLVYQFII